MSIEARIQRMPITGKKAIYSPDPAVCALALLEHLLKEHDSAYISTEVPPEYWCKVTPEGGDPIFIIEDAPEPDEEDED